MEYIWKLQKAYMKDLIDAFPTPKPATTTIATLLKRMSEKGYVGYELHGNSREYYPLVKKDDYFKKHFKKLAKTSFNDSAFQLASFFTKSANLTESELKELRKIVDQELEKKKK